MLGYVSAGLRDLPGFHGNIRTAELFYQFFCSCDHLIRHSGKLGYLDSVALVRAALNDLTQEHDIIPLFLYGDTVVGDTAHGVLQLCQLMVMGGK